MWGTRCFKCGGAGKIYTKRGAQAKALLTSLLSKTAAEIQPGMQYLDSNPVTGKSQWITVTAVSVREDGSINVESKGMNHVMFPNNVVRIAHTAEQKQDAMRKALEFQATLTKSGTVRVK
jgi:hypothetical protein